MIEKKGKVLKFKPLEAEATASVKPPEGRIVFKIPGIPKPKGKVMKLKVLDKGAPVPLSGLEGTPAQLNKIMSMLEDMNKFQGRITELERLYDEEKDKRLVAEGELRALKPQLEKAEAELGRYRQIEKEYGDLKRRYEKLSQEKVELEAQYAREDLKNLKEALWAADGHLDRLKRDLKDGRISEKEYEVKTKGLLRDKWEAQHKMLILEGILKKAIAKTELVVASKERREKKLKLVRKALETEKLEKGKEKVAPSKEKEKPKKVEEKPIKRERRAVPA